MAEFRQKLCKGLPVEFKLMDYRDLNEQFDRIVSVGMMEHVGYKNYKTFFKIAADCLCMDSLFLLHTIGSLTSVKSLDAWTNRYIFPNAMLPSLSQLACASEGLFVVEDVHNFGKYYDDTLMAWYHNFKRTGKKLKPIITKGFTECGNIICFAAQAHSGQEKINLPDCFIKKRAYRGL